MPDGWALDGCGSGRAGGLAGIAGLACRSDVAVYCHTYADSKPILALASRGIYVSVTCRDHDGAVTAEDLAFAGELASQAKHFLAALEELHARTAAEGDTGAA
ncbi:hypothetical protein [Allosalinactinospora lopnorensis]|uniref:hypothetical protein n=1 Tax=Allosalinactinospora lopnorensis TaxID=1352348 RepID=UPI0012E1E2EF|nr:hypothetical protein [Allosalinactinospora lopnorensis]